MFCCSAGRARAPLWINVKMMSESGIKQTEINTDMHIEIDFILCTLIYKQEKWWIENNPSIHNYHI